MLSMGAPNTLIRPAGPTLLDRGMPALCGPSPRTPRKTDQAHLAKSGVGLITVEVPNTLIHQGRRTPSGRSAAQAQTPQGGQERPQQPMCSGDAYRLPNSRHKAGPIRDQCSGQPFGPNRPRTRAKPYSVPGSKWPTLAALQARSEVPSLQVVVTKTEPAGRDLVSGSSLAQALQRQLAARTPLDFSLGDKQDVQTATAAGEPCIISQV